MAPSHASLQKELELMFEILNFARCHGRKILKDQIKTFTNKETRPALQKLLLGEYLKRIEKKNVSIFYALTSKGLNLFTGKRKSESISSELKTDIVKKLAKTTTELEVKPWEVMFQIVHLIGKRQAVTTVQIEEYFSAYFPDVKGTSRASIYRNIKHLRMKGYIKYEKKSHIDQSWYKLSRKGEEIFYMTKTDATQKLRTSSEWDEALKCIFDKVAEEQEKDEQELFYTLENALPAGLEDPEIIWVLYTQASIYELRGNLEKAEEVYLHMEGTCEKLQNNQGRAYALKGLGNVAFKKDRISIAQQYYTKCCRIAEDLQYNPLLSDVLNNMGACLYMEDDVEEALHLFEKAFILVRDDSARQASASYNMGLCYARKEDFVKARKLWKKSLHLYSNLRKITGIKKVQSNLREIDRKEKEEFLEAEYRNALKTGTSKDIEKAYKELARFKTDDLITCTKG